MTRWIPNQSLFFGALALGFLGMLLHQDWPMMLAMFVSGCLYGRGDA